MLELLITNTMTLKAQPFQSIAATLADSTATVPVKAISFVEGVVKESSGNKEQPNGSSHYKRVPMTSPHDEKINGGITFAAQDSLPILPIPDLSSTCDKYLKALKPLQSSREHAETQHAVKEFLRDDGPELQDKLQKYAHGKTSYIEQFCKCC